MIAIDVTLPAIEGGRLIAPVGLSTPHAAPVDVQVTGARVRLAADLLAGQHVMVLTPETDEITLRWVFELGGAAYPEALFQHRDSRYTRAADALAEEATAVATKGGLVGLARHVAGMFSYGHPEERFYDGTDEIPQICSMAVGSCVDINAYFIAAARAAGYEAGYVTGYFVPAEKRNWCEDMHCWVVTRDQGVVQEWDIAHHLKMGTNEVSAGLNPKPGVRLPMAHSMGHNYPSLGVTDLKLVGEPMWLKTDGSWALADVSIGLEGYDALAAAESEAV
ncbi:MAG: transglutaminase domain-containing protein [Paracoccaceae bacterium]